MALTPTTSLAEIATANPSLRPELERLGLDYCCGGKKSLSDACQEQGLDPAAVVAELAQLPQMAEPRAAWQGLGLTDLVDHLESTHHRYLKQELPRLSALAEKVSRVHGEKHPQLVAVAEVFAELRDDLEPHLRKEEEVLFPMICTLAAATSAPRFHCGSLSNPITAMEREHVVVGELLEKLRQITGGYQAPEGTCASTHALMEGLAQLEADTHLHVHKENNHLFPAVIAMEAALRG